MIPLWKKRGNARYLKKLRQRALDKIGHCCIFCGNMYDVECAHVLSTECTGRGRGMNRRYRDVIKHPGAYRPMCKDHHKLYDDGEISLSERRYG